MAANVNFPFICKKNIAHGLESHKMSIIFNEEGLADVQTPCVAQTFINHGALLYKIYAIGTKFHIVKRPSLRNFADSKWSEESTIFFNSHNISSGDCTPNALSTLDVDDDQPQQINESLVQDLAKHLHIDINMSLYGADIIICTKTGRHYIIDVNVFPSYDGVEDYLQQLADHVLFKISLQ
uniref:inositol-1,3,4-trisphosphate 5/6-kinase n=1 Tax=Ciona savignyi TaxID=51511 RepID=H2Z1J8_CIOSA